MVTAPLNLGVITPVLTRFPGLFARWEEDATIDDVRVVAQAAEAHGYDYLTCAEHLAIPPEGWSGPCYWDPLSTFGYLAAVTSRLRFATMVLVLPYHHPLDIAKRYGTLDAISGGRLILGTGVGYLKGEFEAIGAPYEDRGRRSDDALRALRAIFGRRSPSYEGDYFHIKDVVVEPHGVQQDVPIWVGGNTRRSLRRAVELGDGWCPFGLSPHEIAEWLATAAQTDAWAARTTALQVTVPAPEPVDPIGDPEATAATLRDYRDAGAANVQVRFVHDSLAHYLEQLEALAEVKSHI